MKINYTTKNPRLHFLIDSESIKESFKALAEIQEIFDEPCCGLCKSTDLQFTVRTVESNDYYELKCTSCFAKLAFGQHKVGNSIFPKRKLPDGTFDKQHRGWYKWTPET